MPIPNIPVFIDFLNSLMLSEPPDSSGYKSIIAIEPYDGRNRNIPVSFPQQTLWYKDAGSFSIDSLIAKVQSELDSRGHKIDRKIALDIICLYSLLPGNLKAPVASFNDILNNITTADLTQIFLFPKLRPHSPSLQIKPFKFGPFIFSKLDTYTLKYRCQKAESDFYKRYEDELQDRMAIQRDILKVKILNIPRLMDIARERFRYSKPQFNVFGNLIDEYFMRLSQSLFEDFWTAMLEEQHITISIGSTYLNEQILQKIPDAERISIFLNVGAQGMGYVQPHSFKMGMNFNSVDTNLPKAIKRLEDEFSFHSFTKSEIHQTIKTFVLFISKAKRHYWEGNKDEGFLHLIIALDLIFGEKDASTKSISDRVALLVHKRFGSDLETQKKVILKLYDARSKYVHEGRSTDDTLKEQAESVCEEILYCLLRAQRNIKNHEPGFVSSWKRNIDYLVKALEAGIEQPDNMFKENGIWLPK